ncbi:MAG TPA: hypothetical protein VL201_02080 [Patescibacteria group bacterium]|jgi:hypothetical protein|nr:hypothetical protein [Patescibacteria group bacterium]
MTLKKSACAVLVLTGYVTVGFTMENQIENKSDEIGYLRKIRVDDKYIKQTLTRIENNKTPDQLVRDFEVISYESDSEFTDIKDNLIPLTDFSENKPKSLISTYYTWLTCNKK